MSRSSKPTPYLDLVATIEEKVQQTLYWRANDVWHWWFNSSHVPAAIRFTPSALAELVPAVQRRLEKAKHQPIDPMVNGNNVHYALQEDRANAQRSISGVIEVLEKLQELLDGLEGRGHFDAVPRAGVLHTITLDNIDQLSVSRFTEIGYQFPNQAEMRQAMDDGLALLKDAKDAVDVPRWKRPLVDSPRTYVDKFARPRLSAVIEAGRELLERQRQVLVEVETRSDLYQKSHDALERRWKMQEQVIQLTEGIDIVRQLWRDAIALHADDPQQQNKVIGSAMEGMPSDEFDQIIDVVAGAAREEIDFSQKLDLQNQSFLKQELRTL